MDVSGPSLLIESTDSMIINFIGDIGEKEDTLVSSGLFPLNSMALSLDHYLRV